MKKNDSIFALCSLRGFYTLSLLYIFTLVSHAQEVPMLEWTKGMGGTGTATGRDVAIDAAGNVYTIGDFWNTADFDPGAGVFNLTSLGGYDIFVSKLDADGNFLWARSMGGTSYNFGEEIAIDASGNVYTTGWYDGTVDFDPGAGTFNLTANNGSGYYDVFISKLDANGDFVWAKSMGGSGSDEGMGIELDALGNIYVAGSYAYTVDFDPGPAVFNLTSPDYDAAFISKFDSDGNFIWAKKMDGTYNQEVLNLAVDATGNVYTTGRFYASTVDFDPGPGVFNLTADQGDVFISKLDTDGNFVWARSFGGTSDDWGYGITIDASGNVYTTGQFKGTVDFDPGTGIFNLISADIYDIFISKLDINGDFVWAKSFARTATTNDSRGTDIAVDAAGNVYTTGYFYNTADFDPGAGTYFLTPVSSGYRDTFISKLDNMGNFVWATSYGYNSEGKSIVIGDLQTIYITGYFNGTTDFDPGACIFNLNSGAGSDIFVQKLSTGTAIPAPTITSFTPDTGPVGTAVTLTGTNFSSTPSNNLVTFYNNRTATVTASTPTSITTTVPASATTGKISVTVNCITVQSATNFTVGAAPLPTITSFTPTSGPVGTTVTISGTNFSPTPANNTVKFNGTTAIVTASTTTSITTTVPAGAATGKITVTVSGNTATSVPDFTVTVPAATITVNPQPQSVAVCEGEATSFAFSAGGTTNLSYQWQKFNGTVFNNIVNGSGYSGATTPTLTINTTGNFGAGDYRCRVSGDFAVDVFTETVTLAVNPYPSASIAVDGSTLVASPGDSYQWYQNGTELSQATDQSLAFNVVEYGTYRVEVTENGCTSTSDEFVYLITGAESVNDGLKIYPNPVSDNLFIETPDQLSLQLYDALGKELKLLNLNPETLNRLDMQQMADGIYFLRIKSSKTIRVVRIQKK